MSRAVTLGCLLAVALALALRCPQPDARSMHSDEGVNAIKFRELWEHGSYKYDPTEFHGPTLPYFTLAWSKLTGVRDFNHITEGRFRALTVAFGIGLILLLPLLADGFGCRAIVCAAFLIAISPAMVFYSRYYIHEMLLVFFSLLAFGAAWRYAQTKKLIWTLLAGAAFGLMHATKETFVFSLAAATIALVLNEIWIRRFEASIVSTPFKLNFKHLAAGLFLWIAVAMIFFSSFFTNAAGLLDSISTYLPWTHRVEGASPHIHAWNFYFTRLIYFHAARGQTYSEIFILLLAVVGVAAIFKHRSPTGSKLNLLRFVAFYTLVLTVIYCVIPYKTPWCLLNFWIGIILLAGTGTAAMLEWAARGKKKVVLTVALLLGATHLSLQAWQSSVTTPYGPGNPYAYAQTSPDVLELVAKIKALSHAHAQENQMVIKVMAPDSGYWPLPWYLRNFNNVGWWSEVPVDPSAPVMIVSSKFHADFDADKTHVMIGLFKLRPDAFFELYVEAGLWRDYLRAAKPAPTD